ncbi:MAG: hypothetical protein Q9202_004794 [Teloschistes flavicans]
MTFLDEMTMYCSVCGGPIISPDEVGYYKNPWLAEVVLLRQIQNKAPEDTIPPPIEIIPARNKGGPYFIVVPTEEEITACENPALKEPEPEIYFPLHMQCLKILEMIAEARRVPREQALSKVYARLRQDLDQIFDVNVMLRPATNLNNATKYGEIWKFNELQWQSGEGSEMYEVDPLEIPGLREWVVGKIEPLATSSSASVEEAGQESSAPLDGETLKHPILPHILDLDSIPARACHDGNWALLVDKLSSMDIIKPLGVFEDMPLELRNQRRIWALVDDLLDEVVEEEGRG